MFENLIYGFHVAFLPNNLLFCAIGVLVGTLVGVLPGIGPIGAMRVSSCWQASGMGPNMAGLPLPFSSISPEKQPPS
jgi:hypothetical protein